jgi:hypothetical protein
MEQSGQKQYKTTNLLNYCFWTLSINIFFFKFTIHNVSKTGFRLRSQVKSTQLGPIDRISSIID